MSITRNKSSHLQEKDCPVNSKEVDLIPECYHFTNKCLCFLCTCGDHICPSLKKSHYAKGVFSSSYKRSYSKPIVPQAPQRVQAEYHPNTNKMDLRTEYQTEFPGRAGTTSKDTRSHTPQPSFKFEGKSQYHRDFPNWGPVDYHHSKRPVQPLHETKLRFQAKSSYEHFFNAKEIQKNVMKNIDKIAKETFQVPMESTSQREYKAASNDYFARLEPRRVEEYVPVSYNPNQFRSTSRTSYLPVNKIFKDPSLFRKEAILKIKATN